MAPEVFEGRRGKKSDVWSLGITLIEMAEGKNPFALDSRPPKASFTEFLRSQLRYAVLEAQYPKEAKALFAKAEEDAGRRYQRYREMAERI